jgi:hypothetical protein
LIGAAEDWPMCDHRVLALLFTGALLAGPAQAQDLPAIEAAEKALVEAWDKSPLGFRTAVFAEGDVGGFGIYTPRASAVFRIGEPIVVYSEPYGYAWKDNGEGAYSFGFFCDLVLKDKAGKVLVEQPEFGKFQFSSRVRNREFMLKLTLELNDAPPGDFMLEYLVRDAYSKKSAVISLPFTLAK